ncbi:MAG: hypothetical protein KAR19_11605 [Bacteroidales bacterium]|nr:hypothetical protein [Bacteroidales bacterium]
MKITAHIIVFSLIFLGINWFMEVMEPGRLQTELTCEMDCCASHDDCEQEQEGQEHDHTCPSGCDCDCCFHIMAIEYRFLTMSDVEYQSCHYGSYFNNYFFDYYTPLFQPPRLG